MAVLSRQLVEYNISQTNYLNDSTQIKTSDRMLKLYNTLTRKKENFKPIKKGHVGIYSCGPTVYWNQHIGHMYAYVQWDCLVRAMEYMGLKVKWVMNITDVGHMTSDEDVGEDKMEKGAKREGISVWQIADKYIKQFTNSMKLLNINEPDVLCRATKHIQEQIDLIKKIEGNGFAYHTQTGLVFDTSKFKDYVKFAKLNLEEQEAGARVKIDPEKKQPQDFLLWVTNQPDHIMQWDSPWGKGFPGWHIECTAMSTKYLGETFDIHTGGKEHIPVHHTNEIAQGYGAFKHQTANYWLHNEWLMIKGMKISKSLGNAILVSDLQEKNFDPLALRYLIITSQYRKGLVFSWESMESAQKSYERLKNILSGLKDDGEENEKYLKEFSKAISDDLNLPNALAVLWELLRDEKAKGKLRTVKKMDTIFGLDLLKKEKQGTLTKEEEKLIEEREKARKKKDFKKSDEIRSELKRLGVILEDTPDGIKWKKQEKEE